MFPKLLSHFVKYFAELVLFRPTRPFVEDLLCQRFHFLDFLLLFDFCLLVLAVFLVESITVLYLLEEKVRDVRIILGPGCTVVQLCGSDPLFNLCVIWLVTAAVRRLGTSPPGFVNKSVFSLAGHKKRRSRFFVSLNLLGGQVFRNLLQIVVRSFF